MWATLSASRVSKDLQHIIKLTLSQRFVLRHNTTNHIGRDVPLLPELVRATVPLHRSPHKERDHQHTKKGKTDFAVSVATTSIG